MDVPKQQNGPAAMLVFQESRVSWSFFLMPLSLKTVEVQIKGGL